MVVSPLKKSQLQLEYGVLSVELGGVTEKKACDQTVPCGTNCCFYKWNLCPVTTPSCVFVSFCNSSMSRYQARLDIDFVYVVWII